MSSHLMFGTSTTVSRREDGFTVPIADLKCSWLTAMESRISASIVSSSRSMRSIFSRMQVNAASVQSWAKSAPTKPCVLEATSSSFTSEASFMFLQWMRRISSLPLSSGTPMSSSRSNRPKRRNAASIELGLFVAAMTTTCPRPLMPSMSVSSCETTRFSTSPLVLSRFGAMESISSMKMIAGEFFSASSKAFRRFDSASPAILDMISGPFIRKKNAPVSLATARAISVLPLPGGPYSRTPLGGFTPNVLKRVGCLNGSSIISRICPIAFLQPPMSSYPTSSNRSSSSRFTGSPSQWITVSGATITNSPGSTPTTLNSTGRKPPRTRKRSP
mmetsp:Transcript_37393/g.86370  ORF Transcript_37393/g.86370 Transcript_37393/m.86370 type:complete len:331 (-) Transcript_37393:235-1227(-)